MSEDTKMIIDLDEEKVKDIRIYTKVPLKYMWTQILTSILSLVMEGCDTGLSVGDHTIKGDLLVTIKYDLDPAANSVPKAAVAEYALAFCKEFQDELLSALDSLRHAKAKLPRNVLECMYVIYGSTLDASAKQTLDTMPLINTGYAGCVFEKLLSFALDDTVTATVKKNINTYVINGQTNEETKYDILEKRIATKCGARIGDVKKLPYLKDNIMRVLKFMPQNYIYIERHMGLSNSTQVDLYYELIKMYALAYASQGVEEIKDEVLAKLVQVVLKLANSISDKSDGSSTQANGNAADTLRTVVKQLTELIAAHDTRTSGNPMELLRIVVSKLAELTKSTSNKDTIAAALRKVVEQLSSLGPDDALNQLRKVVEQLTQAAQSKDIAHLLHDVVDTLQNMATNSTNTTDILNALKTVIERLKSLHQEALKKVVDTGTADSLKQIVDTLINLLTPSPTPAPADILPVLQSAVTTLVALSNKNAGDTELVSKLRRVVVQLMEIVRKGNEAAKSADALHEVAEQLKGLVGVGTEGDVARVLKDVVKKLSGMVSAREAQADPATILRDVVAKLANLVRKCPEDTAMAEKLRQVTEELNKCKDQHKVYVLEAFRKVVKQLEDLADTEESDADVENALRTVVERLDDLTHIDDDRANSAEVLEKVVEKLTEYAMDDRDYVAELGEYILAKLNEIRGLLEDVVTNNASQHGQSLGALKNVLRRLFLTAEARKKIIRTQEETLRQLKELYNFTVTKFATIHDAITTVLATNPAAAERLANILPVLGGMAITIRPGLYGMLIWAYIAFVVLAFSAAITHPLMLRFHIHADYFHAAFACIYVVLLATTMFLCWAATHGS